MSKFNKSLTKSYVESNFLSTILNKFPNLQVYFEENVLPAWKKVKFEIKLLLLYIFKGLQKDREYPNSV